jgi:hypothetical protein
VNETRFAGPYLEYPGQHYTDGIRFIEKYTRSCPPYRYRKEAVEVNSLLNPRYAIRDDGIYLGKKINSKQASKKKRGGGGCIMEMEEGGKTNRAKVWWSGRDHV